MFLTCICIIKGTLVVSGFTLVRRCLEKVFRPTRDILKENDPYTNFLTHEFFYILFSHYY